jgi:hypothetical protein
VPLAHLKKPIRNGVVSAVYMRPGASYNCQNIIGSPVLASHLLGALCGIVLRFIARLSTREAQT